MLSMDSLGKIRLEPVNEERDLVTEMMTINTQEVNTHKFKFN